jgi:hypothetical protein
VELGAPAASGADATGHDVCARRRLGPSQCLPTLRLELVPVGSNHDEVAVRAGLPSAGRLGCEHVAPRGDALLGRERRPRRSSAFGLREQALECVADCVRRRLDEGAAAILRCDELRPAAGVAGEERDTVLEARVDDVRRVVDERRHDRERSGLTEELERRRPVEVGEEADSGPAGERGAHAGPRPVRRLAPQKDELHVPERAFSEQVHRVDERLDPLAWLEPAEEDEPTDPPGRAVCRPGARLREVRHDD